MWPIYGGYHGFNSSNRPDQSPRSLGPCVVFCRTKISKKIDIIELWAVGIGSISTKIKCCCQLCMFNYRTFIHSNNGSSRYIYFCLSKYTHWLSPSRTLPSVSLMLRPKSESSPRHESIMQWSDLKLDLIHHWITEAVTKTPPVICCNIGDISYIYGL